MRSYIYKSALPHYDPSLENSLRYAVSQQPWGVLSFNERSGASSSEGGGEFECRVSTYLPSFFFLGGGVILIPSGGSIYCT